MDSENANKSKKKKTSNIIQICIGVLAVVLAALIIVMMGIVSSIQGTARVVNYAGLVRGKTQRIIKLEISGQPEDGMIQDIEAFVDGLRNGNGELGLVRLDDGAFQSKMQELEEYFAALHYEILRVREVGYENTEIIDKSERFFEICDEATGLAEAYSQRKASSLTVIEKYITIDIIVLMLLIGYEFIKAVRFAAMNRALQKKVYLDKATGLPNKNKCEELLDDPEPAAENVGVCSFDLNNLRRINNSMGHEAGDAYIRRFAVCLRASMPAEQAPERMISAFSMITTLSEGSSFAASVATKHPALPPPMIRRSHVTTCISMSDNCFGWKGCIRLAAILAIVVLLKTISECGIHLEDKIRAYRPLFYQSGNSF